MAVDSSGLPVAVSVASASPHEATLVEQALEARPVEEKPERLIADRGHTTPTRSTRSWGVMASSRSPHTPEEPQEALDPGRARAATLQEALEERAILRLARQFPAFDRPLRAQGRQLFGLRAPGMHRNLTRALAGVV
jgi:hypothetical protein